DLPRAEAAQIDGGAQRPPDQPLDLLSAPAGVAAGSRVRRPRQHAVLGGDPALALPFEKAGHLLLHRRSADEPGFTERDQDRSLGITIEIGLDGDWSQLICASSVDSHDARESTLCDRAYGSPHAHGQIFDSRGQGSRRTPGIWVTLDRS